MLHKVGTSLRKKYKEPEEVKPSLLALLKVDFRCKIHTKFCRAISHADGIAKWFDFLPGPQTLWTPLSLVPLKLTCYKSSRNLLSFLIILLSSSLSISLIFSDPQEDVLSIFPFLCPDNSRRYKYETIVRCEIILVTLSTRFSVWLHLLSTRRIKIFFTLIFILSFVV